MHVAGIRGFPAPTSGNCRRVGSGVVVHERDRGPARVPWRVRGGFSASERDGACRGRHRALALARSHPRFRAPGPTRHTPVGPGYVPHAGDAPAGTPDLRSEPGGFRP